MTNVFHKINVTVINYIVKLYCYPSHNSVVSVLLIYFKPKVPKQLIEIVNGFSINVKTNYLLVTKI